MQGKWAQENKDHWANLLTHYKANDISLHKNSFAVKKPRRFVNTTILCEYVHFHLAAVWGGKVFTKSNFIVCKRYILISHSEATFCLEMSFILIKHWSAFQMLLFCQNLLLNWKWTFVSMLSLFAEYFRYFRNQTCGIKIFSGLFKIANEP